MPRRVHGRRLDVTSANLRFYAPGVSRGAGAYTSPRYRLTNTALKVNSHFKSFPVFISEDTFLDLTNLFPRVKY